MTNRIAKHHRLRVARNAIRVLGSIDRSASLLFCILFHISLCLFLSKYAAAILRARSSFVLFLSVQLTLSYCSRIEYRYSNVNRSITDDRTDNNDETMTDIRNDDNETMEIKIIQSLYI